MIMTQWSIGVAIFIIESIAIWSVTMALPMWPSGMKVMTSPPSIMPMACVAGHGVARHGAAGHRVVGRGHWQRDEGERRKGRAAQTMAASR